MILRKPLITKALGYQLEKYFNRGLKGRDWHIKILAAIPLALCAIITLIHYRDLSQTIPLWYTKPWGNQILTARANIFVLPVGSALFTIAVYILTYFTKKFYFTYLSQILLTGAFIFNTVVLGAALRVIYLSTQNPIFLMSFSTQTQTLALLLILGFFSSYLILPQFIAWAFNKNLVTDPSLHQHPGMILTKPSARGGGFIFSVLLGTLSLLFLEKTPTLIGITLGVFLCGVIGLLDDVQNTSQKSKLQFMENPLVRLLVFLPIPVVAMMTFGIVSGYINNPFDGNINLTSFSLIIGGHTITPLPYVFTLLWTLVIMNLVSWSNGVDGQFGGVSGISTLIIGFLALRLVETEPAQLNTAKLAFLAAGLSFGFIPHTWHPSKIMWGFGATSVGLLLASLSIVSRAKVATAIVVIMIPFLDGFITILRRLLKRKNPLKGDRGHLHHLLLERGWSSKKVAFFYWVATAIFGIIGLVSADRASALVLLTLGGAVAAGIILLNISSRISRQKIKGSEEDKTRLQELV